MKFRKLRHGLARLIYAFFDLVLGKGGKTVCYKKHPAIYYPRWDVVECLECMK